MPRRHAALAWACIAALVMLAIWSVYAQRADMAKMPHVDVVRAVNESVAPRVEGTDMVRALPVWFDDARIGFDGAAFSLSRTTDAWDVAEFERIWLAWDTAYPEQAAETRTWLTDIETVAEGPGYRIEVGRTVPDVELLWDARRNLDRATVTQVDDQDAETPCSRWEDEAWHCGRVDEYVWVGRAVQEMDDTYRRCVYATAPPAPHRWRIEWDDVELGDTFRLRAGNTSWAVRMPRGQPVQLRAWLDDELVVERSWAIDEDGYPEFAFDTSGRAGQRARVRIEIGAADHFDRFFCFRAQTVNSR